MAKLVPAENNAPRARLVPADDSTPFSMTALSGVMKDYNPVLNPVKSLQLYGDVGKQFIRGGMDFATGAGQLVSNLVDPIIPGQADRYSGAMKSMEAGYQSDRGEFAGSVEPARIASNIITSLAMAGGGVSPASLWGRMKEGAKVAGMTSAAAPIDPDNENYGLTKALTVGGSALLGGLAPPIVEGGIKAAGWVANKVGNVISGLMNTASGKTTPAAIESTLKLEFQRSGVDWSRLSQEYRNNLISETQNALKAGGRLDPQAAQRLADFQRVGATPLSGQVSRNPYQFANEQNLARMEVGAPIAQRLGEQQQRFGQVLDDIKPTTGDAYTAGQRVEGALRGRDAARKAVVDSAYGAARDSSGRAAPMDASTFSRQANDALDSRMLGNYLPAEARSILNDVSSGKIPLNVNTAVQIDQTLSAAQRAAGNGTPQALAISQVRNALNSAPISTGAGQEAKAAFDSARGLAARRFAAQEASPALGAVTSGEAPAAEKFVETFVIRSPVAETARNLRAMGPEARVQARGNVIDWIKEKAVNGEKFSPAGLKKALDTIGNRKLNLIFAGDREGLATLQALRRASSNAITPPVASGVNYSGSGTMAMDSLDKISRIPILGGLLPKGGDIVRASQVSNSLNLPGLAQQGAPLIPQDILNAISRTGGLLAAPAAAAAAPFGLLGAKQ